MDAKVEVESRKVTKLMVPIDCNGCVKRFERKLNAIEGVEKVKIDMAEQTILIFGDADQEQILKAARKVRKTAKLCSLVKNKSESKDPKTIGEEEEEEEEDEEESIHMKLPFPVKNKPLNEELKTTEEDEEDKFLNDWIMNNQKVPSSVKNKPSIEDMKTTEEDEEDKCLNDWNMNNHANYSSYYSNMNHYSYSNYYNGYDELHSENNHDESKDKVVQEAETNYGEIDVNQITELFSDENPNACIIM